MIKKTTSSDTLTAFIRSLDNPLLDMDYRPGLERVRNVLAHHFPAPRPKLRICIANTNGKGSTGYFLENAFKASGFTTVFLHTLGVSPCSAHNGLGMKNIGKPYARFDEGGLAMPALYSTVFPLLTVTVFPRMT